jgi:hypothetical protein
LKEAMQTLSNIEITILVLVISASVSAMTTFVVSYFIERFTWRQGSRAHLLQHSFERKAENDRFLKLRWGVNYIRDGRDNVVPNLSEREKWFARLKNQIIYFKGHYQKKAKIRFYRTLGCQFKCFIELDDPELFGDLKDFLERNGYEDISKGKKYSINRFLRKCKVIERIWFIHKDADQYDEVTTPEGFVNNFLYPE